MPHLPHVVSLLTLSRRLLLSYFTTFIVKLSQLSTIIAQVSNDELKCSLGEVHGILKAVEVLKNYFVN